MSERTVQTLSLGGCRQNNLSGFDVEIPLRQLVAVLGPSGSGRRSFVFGTVHAESRRRYLETFSSSMRGRIDGFPRPRLDRAERLPLTVAIGADSVSTGPRNTVATATGLLPLLGHLFVRFSQPYCSRCERVVQRWTPQEIAEQLRTFPAGSRLLIGFLLRESLPLAEGADWLRKAGFSRAIYEGAIRPLEELSGETGPIPPGGLAVIVDRVKPETEMARLRESLELCFRGGRQDCFVLAETDNRGVNAGTTWTIDGQSWAMRRYHSGFVCTGCETEYPDPVAERFQFGTALGACPRCHGRGSVRSSSAQTRETCPECRGDRFAPASAAFQIAGRSLPELLAQPIERLHEFCQGLAQRGEAAGVVEAIERRVQLLTEVALGGLPLCEAIADLCASERRRVALVQGVAAPLTGALYLIDSLTSDIPQDELAGLLTQVTRLREAGCSVWVIDDHPRLVALADQVLRFGPGAGTAGGQVVEHAEPTERQAHEPELTSEPRSHSPSTPKRTLNVDFPAVGRSLSIPLGAFSVLTGSSRVRPVHFVRKVLLPLLSSTSREEFDELVMIGPDDRRPHSRAHVLGGIQVFPTVRALFAETAEARRRNVSAGDFSPHTAGGLRCPECEGSGRIAVDLQHLPDLEIVCPECLGTRYQGVVSEIRFRGLDLVEVLDLTVDDAFRFFKGQPQVQRRLQMLRELRLQYLRLGQPLNQLSLGERCRLRLAKEFARVSQARRLYLIEEPTTGLSREEVRLLAETFQRIATAGGTVVAIDPHDELVRGGAEAVELGWRL